ncbi:conjugal transfer protein TraF [Pseudomonadales bacterium]|nr:conjugal transfer protein TraF [Pseudomonadales bacterium]
MKLKGAQSVRIVFSTIASLAIACAHADNFNARNSAMGGVGVASSNYDAAALYNPALLTRKATSDGISIILPAIGIEASDKEDVIEKLDGLVDIFDELDAAIDAVDAVAAESAKDRILSDLAEIDAKPVRIHAGAAIVIAVPGESVGYSFDVRNSQDLAVLADFDENDEAVLDNAISTGDTSTIDSDLGSSAVALGASVTELVFSFAKNVQMGGRQYSFAVAPKYQTVETILYSQGANDFDSDDFDADDSTLDDSNFNIDIGMALFLNEKVTIGATFKNLISDEYQTVIDPSSGQSGVYQVDPTITVGVGYETSFMSTSVDVDLLPVKSFKRFEDSQFLRAGVELNAANWVQLRLGVRVDLEDTRENVATVGFGLSPFDIFHIGLTAIAGENETYGLALELKLTL